MGRWVRGAGERAGAAERQGVPGGGSVSESKRRRVSQGQALERRGRKRPSRCVSPRGRWGSTLMQRLLCARLGGGSGRIFGSGGTWAPRALLTVWSGADTHPRGTLVSSKEVRARPSSWDSLGRHVASAGQVSGT